MPRRAARVCAYPGCGELAVGGSRCARHREAYHQQPYRVWYSTRRWREIRARQLQHSPWCELCAEDGRVVVATDVDHVEPHRGDEERFFAGPFQSLCHACHSRKTQREMMEGYAQKKVFM